MKNIFGLVLIFLGLALIFFSIYSSYNIFNNKSAPPQIFNYTERSEKESATVGDIQKTIETAVQKQIKDILPEAATNQILNLIAWSLFSGILIFSGSAISRIGLLFLRETCFCHGVQGKTQ